MKNYFTYLFILLIVPIIFFNILPKEKVSKAKDVNIISENTPKLMEENSEDNEPKKSIALTFDDGPSIYTDRLLDILSKYNSHATFFMLGINLNTSYKDTLIKLINNKNELGSHTYSHKMLTHVKKSLLSKEIEYNKTLLSNISNSNVYLTRPPYGSINKYITNNFDTPYILWNIDPKDWRVRDAKKIYNHVINQVSDGDIILLHETYLSSIEAVNLIIPELINQNYEFLTISELAAKKNITIENNKIYSYFK